MDFILTQKNLKEILHYNKNTGVFTWKNHPARNIKNNTIAGSTTREYISIRINGKHYSAHRLAWLYVYGYMPESYIDHINRSKHDNRIKNLREVSPQCNNRNAGISQNNKTGINGICKHKLKSGWKWRADIMVDRKQVYLGLFKSFTEAVKARWEAEKRYNWANCCTTSSSYVYLKSVGEV